MRIWEEGLEINVIGASSLDSTPLLPNVVRVAWLIVSMQGFKKQVGWIPWEMFRTIEVAGLPMMQSLVIDATIVYPSFRGDALAAKVADRISFRDADFQEPLERIAATVQAFYDDPDARNALPSLHN